ncbi:histidine phosphatase family protein [Vibrio rarus]|uniref:histidine phosphatase family protein n=1 Tax=Vibrio rarus TaxID=413403 RepID=UPI0021C2DB0C|nr:histidine phosphatase family protein [Vibrio rarus]
MTRIIVLRHGETQFNFERKLQGHCNSPLTNKGTVQAKNYGIVLREHLLGCEFEVHASPLGRAMQTARLVCEEVGYPEKAILEDVRLKEFNLGDWEKRSIPTLVQEQPDLLANKDWYLQAPNAETYDEVRARLSSWLVDTPNEKDLVVVSHGLTGIVLRGLLLGMEYNETWQQDLPQDAFFIIENNKVRRISCTDTPEMAEML